MYYDLIGQPLAGFIASNSYGLSTSLATPPNVYTSSQLPRFVGFNQIPSAPNAPLFFQPAPKPVFPVSYPNAFAIASSLDDRLKAPYTMNLNFSIGREFSHGWFVQASYVGRLSRHNLVQRDLAMPTNLVDPKSGQSYYQAMTQLATLMDLQHVSIANLPKIPFFENFWAKAGGNGLTPTQVVAQDYLYNANQGDFTSVLSDIDNGQSCNANGISTFGSNGHVSTVGCSVLGPYSMWSSQYSALNAWSSLGSGAYHAMQWTVSKRLSSALTMTLNYTLSKSIDIGSRSESLGAYSSDFMINSWNAQQLRGVSRYDALPPGQRLLRLSIALRPRQTVRHEHEQGARRCRGRMGDLRHVAPDLGPAVLRERTAPAGPPTGNSARYATPNGNGDSPDCQRAHRFGGFRPARAQPVEQSDGRAGRFPD